MLLYVLLFQKKGCCDEKMMKEWTANEWAKYFTNPPTPGSSGKILVASQSTANCECEKVTSK